MKKNLEQAMLLVDRALAVVPDEDTDIKNRLKSILRVIKATKKKKGEAKKLTPAEKWRFDLETSQILFQNPVNPKEWVPNVLKNIEDMIQKEEEKLKEGQNEEVGTILD